MRSSVVEKSDFCTRARDVARLDAEFVDPDLLASERALRRMPGAEVSALIDAVQTLSDDADAEREVSYVPIDAIDTIDGLLFPSELRASELPSRARWVVEPDDILVSNVRPNRGAVSLVGVRHAQAIATSGVTVLRLRGDAPICANYLFAFLKSPFARNQLIRRNRGSMYPAVLSEDIGDVWVPVPPPKIRSAVDKLVTQAQAYLRTFYERHEDATRVLAELLRPYGAPPNSIVASSRAVEATVVTRGDCYGPRGASRIDAEFFRKGYEQFDAACRAAGPSFLLGDHFTLSPGEGIPKGDEADVPVVKQAVLTNIGVNWSALAFERGRLPRQAAVHNDDILLACAAHEIPYIGRKVDLVRDLPEFAAGNACVADVMIIRPTASRPPWLSLSYVAAFLRHETGKHQVQRCIRGLRGGHVYKDDLSTRVRLPIPPRRWLADFETVAEQAESARNAGKAAILQATEAVATWLTSTIGPPPTPHVGLTDV